MNEKKEKANYIDNKKFYSEIVKYREIIEKNKLEGKTPPQLTNYLGDCIVRIATRLSTMPRFINYSFRDEMIADAIENCMVYFHDFDPVRYQNPFAYFTQVVYYAFLRRIAKEEKDRYTKYKFFRDTLIDSSDLVDEDDNRVVSGKMYDNINAFMERFEAKEAEKKRKRKELKGLQKFARQEIMNDQGKIEPTDPDPELIG